MAPARDDLFFRRCIMNAWNILARGGPRAGRPTAERAWRCSRAVPALVLAAGTTLGVLASDEARAQFVRGDADSDGRIDLTDGIRILSFIFVGGPEPECMDAADANDSGALDISDAIWILSWLFVDGPPPLPPSPISPSYAVEDCGLDPTPDELGCAFSPCP
jgi:hypothetical protein